MDRLLLTGGERMLRENLAAALSDRFDVTLALENSADRAGEIRSAVARVAPDWAIHCGPAARSSWAPNAAPWSAAAESSLARDLCAAVTARGGRFTLVSSDAVFAGPQIFSEEQDPADDGPAAQAVRVVERSLEGAAALVVRAHVYGWSAGGVSWVERLWDALAAGSELRMDARSYATPILATDLAELLFRADQARLQGLYHLSGAERTSPLRFAGELAAAGGFDASKLSASEAGSPCLDRETSLNSRRARRALGHPLPTLRDGLATFAAQAGNGFRDRLCSAPLTNAAA